MSGPAEDSYDVIVIGAGPIGQTVTDRARAAGLSVAAVERELVGGECSYWACIPSKAMLRPVVAVADARRQPLTDDIGRTPWAWSPAPGWTSTTPAWSARTRTAGCTPWAMSTGTPC